jgi:hypothetical protein
MVPANPAGVHRLFGLSGECSGMVVYVFLTVVEIDAAIP